MHPRLDEIARYVDRQRADLLAAAAPLPAPLWTARPAEGQWSVADVFEHLHRVERSCARVIGRAAEEARAAGHPPELAEGSLMDCLDFAGLTDRSRKIVAPERVAPEGGWDRERALTAIHESRAALQQAIATADGMALGTVRAEHGRLGDIDLYQWILFIGKHEARHVAQVAEIVAAVGATH